jgi:hypothetical protein
MQILPNTPIISLLFGLTTGLAVGLFYLAARRSGRTLLVLLAWLLLQAAVGLSGFYTISNTMPPRLALLLGPPLLAIVGLFATAAGRRYLAGLRLETLTLLHVVRVPVELVLFSLFLHKAVPQLMTFEGRNWDILAGLTAPVVYYFVFQKKLLGRRGLLLWNVLGWFPCSISWPTRCWQPPPPYSASPSSSPTWPFCISRLCGCRAAWCHWYCWRT